jgi:uncharacterized protein YkwD
VSSLQELKNLVSKLEAELMPAEPTELETYFLALVNATRTAAGASPLSFDDELMVAADDHSAWMDATDTLSHTGANGSSPGDRISAAGYEATGWGENIWYSSGNDQAANNDSVEASHQWFVNSPGHYQNLINSDFEEVGISFIEGDYQGQPAVFATLVFGTPTAEEEAENDSANTTSDAGYFIA